MPHKSFSYKLAQLIAVGGIKQLTRPQWHGLEHLPTSGGFIVVSNHTSHADPITIGQPMVERGLVPRFLAKDELFKVPVFGGIMHRAGQIPVMRESRHAGTAFDAAVRAINAGEALVIYPEGTVTRDPNGWPMRGKSGAARIALSTNCPVIPAAQWGVAEVWAPNAKTPNFRRRQPVQVSFGPPLDLSAFTAASPTDLKQATDVIMAAITGLLEQLRGETAPTTRWDPKAHGQSVTGRFQRKEGTG